MSSVDEDTQQVRAGTEPSENVERDEGWDRATIDRQPGLLERWMRS